MWMVRFWVSITFERRVRINICSNHTWKKSDYMVILSQIDLFFLENSRQPGKYQGYWETSSIFVLTWKFYSGIHLFWIFLERTRNSSLFLCKWRRRQVIFFSSVNHLTWQIYAGMYQPHFCDLTFGQEGDMMIWPHMVMVPHAIPIYIVCWIVRMHSSNSSTVWFPLRNSHLFIFLEFQSICITVYAMCAVRGWTT